MNTNTKEFEFSKELDIFLKQFGFIRKDDWAYTRSLGRKGVGTDKGDEEVYINKDFIRLFTKFTQEDLINENRELRFKLHKIGRLLQNE